MPHPEIHARERGTEGEIPRRVGEDEQTGSVLGCGAQQLLVVRVTANDAVHDHDVSRRDTVGGKIP